MRTTVTKLLRSRVEKHINTRLVGHCKENATVLKLTQWSKEFEELMRQRLLVGAFRYGKLLRSKNYNNDNIGSAIQRLYLYQQTGNQEHLVDAANLCMVEYTTGNHPLAHFHSEDDGIHVEENK